MDHVFNLSPLDNRYQRYCKALAPIFSEAGLIKARLHIEIAWLKFMGQQPDFAPYIPKLAPADIQALTEIENNFDQHAIARVLEIERKTQHDVKAVEIYLQEKFSQSTALQAWIPWVHFACTSEDINNLAYAHLWQTGLQKVILPGYQDLIETLRQQASTWQAVAMPAHTHGQSASPTTLGKELNVYAYRLDTRLQRARFDEVWGKFSGAVGNFNAHTAAMPELDWPTLAQTFVTRLGLHFNPVVTQIEPHDQLAAQCMDLAQLNTILLDCCKDMWTYISHGYLVQTHEKDQVGSSTMPHKVNPIQFENAEGNLGIANALLQHFAAKLPISRLQRDLSDSTVLRNLGSALGYIAIAQANVAKGLSKISPNPKLAEAFANNWQILTEAVQTILRTAGHTDAYEVMRGHSQGQYMTESDYLAMIEGLPIDNDLKNRLKTLTPTSYLGKASLLATVKT